MDILETALNISRNAEKELRKKQKKPQKKKTGYALYFGNVLMPIPPESIEMKINNKNETLDLLNGGEINIRKAPGLTDIKMDLSIPNIKYPFATYRNGFKRAYYYLRYLEKLKSERKVFSYILIRHLPDGTKLFQTAMKVTLEEYTIKEDAENGFDVVVEVKLKQYKAFKAKKAKLIITTKDKINAEKKRNYQIKKECERLEKMKRLPTFHKVKKTDTLWSLAKTYYGDELKYQGIYKANKYNKKSSAEEQKNQLKNPEDLRTGMVLIIPKYNTKKKVYEW